MNPNLRLSQISCIEGKFVQFLFDDPHRSLGCEFTSYKEPCYLYNKDCAKFVCCLFSLPNKYIQHEFDTISKYNCCLKVTYRVLLL